jgi:predicted RNA-binding protein (virulence factor B family)
MALLGRYNSLQIVKHVDFGLYLDGGADGEILLPGRYIPKNAETEVDDWLNVFIYLDSEDQLIATTEKPKVQVGEFASLKVKDINGAGIFLDWGLSKDLLMPYSEEARPLKIGDYCVVHVYLDKRTRRITATSRLDRYLDVTPADYKVGQPVELLVAGETPMGFKAIINNRHWGLIHKNEGVQVPALGHAREGLHQGSAPRRQDRPEPAAGGRRPGRQPARADHGAPGGRRRGVGGVRQERPGVDQQAVQRQQGQLQEGHWRVVQAGPDRHP